MKNTINSAIESSNETHGGAKIADRPRTYTYII